MMNKKIFKYYLLLLSLLFSQIPNERLYITIQMMDQVGIINTENNQIESIVEVEMQDSNNLLDCMEYTSEIECDMLDSCEWMMEMCMESMDNNDINTPHFIVMDEILGYWFVTTIASGYIAQYSLVDNEFIDSYLVGDAPAILVIDTETSDIRTNILSTDSPSAVQPLAKSPVVISVGSTAFPDELIENEPPLRSCVKL